MRVQDEWNQQRTSAAGSRVPGWLNAARLEVVPFPDYCEVSSAGVGLSFRAHLQNPSAVKVIRERMTFFARDDMEV